MHSAAYSRLEARFTQVKGRQCSLQYSLAVTVSSGLKKKNVRFIRIEALESADTVPPAHKVLFSFDLPHTTGIAQATQSAAH